MRKGKVTFDFPPREAEKKQGSGEVMPPDPQAPVNDKWINKFLQHLATDRGASAYTQRNYRQAMWEFHRWHQEERQQPPVWEQFSGMTSALTRGSWGDIT